jgi:hypothetical protein
MASTSEAKSVMTPEDQITEKQMDPNELYREEIFTDRKLGTIRRLTPVTSEGGTDTGRAVIYVGQAQILTAAGALPINFEIPARSLAEAVEGFAEAASTGVDQAMKELEQLRRDAASSIIVPEVGAAPPNPMAPGGGGKIQMP